MNKCKVCQAQDLPFTPVELYNFGRWQLCQSCNTMAISIRSQYLAGQFTHDGIVSQMRVNRGLSPTLVETEREAFDWLSEQGCNWGEYTDGAFIIVSGWDVVKSPEWETVLKLTTPYDGDNFDSDYWGFYDEYDTCHGCNKIIRTSPDSYSWSPEFWLSDYEGYICAECVETDPEEYVAWLVEKAKENDSCHGCHLVNPTDHGFTLILQGLENGLHRGQNDNPLAVQEWANEHGLAVLWTTQSGQFDVKFNGYFATDDNGEYTKLTSEQIENIADALIEESVDYHYKTVTYLRSEFKEYPTPAQRCEQALKSLSKPFAKIDVHSGKVQEYDTFAEMEENA